MSAANVYFDESGEFLVLPLASFGVGGWVVVNEPERLRWDGGSTRALGEKVRKCLVISAHRVATSFDQSDSLFRSLTGAKSWRAFARTRQLVDVETEDADGLVRVGFLRRDARFSYGATLEDPPEWTVRLPRDAPPEALGGAVIQVLRAGGVPVSGAPASQAEDDDAGPDETCYADFKAGLLASFRYFADTQGEPAELAVTSVLDEAADTMWASGVLIACGIVTASVICLREGFLLDYLEDRVHQLEDVTDRLEGQDLVCYQEDQATLNRLLSSPYKVVEAEHPAEYFV